MGLQLLVKALVSAAVIVAVTEVNRRSSYWSAILISLPLVSLLAMIWMKVEGQAAQAIADHARGTFWFVLPSLPMFLILPRLLEARWNFYVSLAVCCVVTAGLYWVMDQMLRRFGIW
ncbi:MAG TPA: DUF3147 family protein [Verrucomicrobiales bacterium]|nr:DUF3147 family protein [Verrucomicrobiales bacterium]